MDIGKKNESNSSMMVAVAAIVALVVGGVGGYMLGGNMMNEPVANTNSSNTASAEPTTMTKAADLRALLNNLETEHVALASAATRAGFDGDKSFEATAGALDNNSKEIAAAVGSVYGEEAEKRFYDIWASHIGFFVDYTVAAKGGDQAGMDKAVENLNGYVEAISTFLSEANPNLPKEAVAQLVTEHVMLLKGAVDAHGAGNFAESYAKQHEADTQIGTIADAMAGAIVQQKPESFR